MIFASPSSLAREITRYTEQDCINHGLIRKPPPPRPAPRDFANKIGANAAIGPGLIASSVSVKTTDNHSGVGWILDFGPEIPAEAAAGTLSYSSWDILMSQRNIIVVLFDSGTLTIRFYVHDIVEAVFVGAAQVAQEKFESTGSFDWAK